MVSDFCEDRYVEKLLISNVKFLFHSLFKNGYFTFNILKQYIKKILLVNPFYMKNWREPKNIKHEIRQESTLPSYINLIIKPFSSVSLPYALLYYEETSVNAWEWGTNKFLLRQPFCFFSLLRNFFFSFSISIWFRFCCKIKILRLSFSDLSKHFARRWNGHNVFYYRFTSIFFILSFPVSKLSHDLWIKILLGFVSGVVEE